MTMKAACLYGKKDIRIKEVPVPEIGDNEVLLKVKSAFLCGTDLRMYKNGYPGVFEASPLIPGHELSGIIEKTGKEVRGYTEGMAVAVAPNMGCGSCNSCVGGNTQLCKVNFRAFGINIDGGFAEYVKIPEDAVKQGNMVEFKNLSFEEAALAEPLSCVFNAFQRYNVQPADIVLIIGAGPIGLMHGKLADMAGASKVIINDIRQERLDLAKTVEPGFLTSEGDEIRSLVTKLTGGEGVQVIVTACPAPEAQVLAMELVAMNGRVSFFGGLPKDRAQVPIDTNLIHYKQITVTGTTMQNLEQYRKCIRLIENGIIEVKPLITDTYPVENIIDAYNKTMLGKGIKHSISW